MDYEKYIELYRQGKFSEAVAYKATQIPTRLVKYYSLNDDKNTNESKIQYLKEQRIFLSPFTGFNDPFEGKFFRFDKEKLDSCGWDREMVITFFISLAKSFKYTCLSDTDENNMPMWAYYANNHQGFCVEYLLCEMQKKYIFPVTYEPERVSANAITTNLLYEYMKMREEGKDYTDTSADANVYLQMMILSLAAKHKSWEHEREYRIICHRDDFPAIPSEIYIGLNCKEEYRKELIEVGKSIDVCKVYQMEFDEDSEVFGLKKKLIIDVENKMNKS